MALISNSANLADAAGCQLVKARETSHGAFTPPDTQPAQT